MASHSSTLAWKIPWNGGAWWAAVHGVAKSRTRLSNFIFTFLCHALEKEMATHSSVLAWRIPGTAGPGGLPSMGSHRVGHDWSNLAAAAVLSGVSHVQLFETLTTAARQAPLSMGFSRQEYWSGLPCPPPGGLSDLGIKPLSLTSPALAGGFFTTWVTWEAHLSADYVPYDLLLFHQSSLQSFVIMLFLGK